jgi:tetratricopeptide (TPR) repeat protein
LGKGNDMTFVKTTMKQGIIILTILLFLKSCDSKTAQDYLNEADKLSEQKNHKEAIELFDKAIQKRPKISRCIYKSWCFTIYFYEFEPLRPLINSNADILALEENILKIKKTVME